MNFSSTELSRFTVNQRERIVFWPGYFWIFRRFIRVLKSLLARTSFEEYEWAVKKTAIYPSDQALVYLALGLADESGEVAGKFKKLIRDSKGVPTEQFYRDVKKELGDVAYYLTRLSNELGFSLEDVLAENTEKLADRQKRGVIQGSGDNR